MSDLSADTPYPTWARFHFTGTAPEYFRIWIVNILLTILTLGIYSAWAKVRTTRYFYGSTQLNGSSFQFTAEPLTILKSRVVAVLIFAVYWVASNAYPQAGLWLLLALALAYPLLIVASSAFRMRHTVYRNVNFHFDRDFGGAYRLFILPLGVVVGLTALMYLAWLGSEMAALMENQDESGDFRREDMFLTFFFLALFPVVPLFMCLVRRFVIFRTHYGNLDGVFSGTVWEFYRPYVIAFFASGGAMIGFAMLIGIAAVVTGIDESALENGDGLSDQASAATLALVFGFYGLGFYLYGYINSRIENLTYNRTSFGPVLLHSRLRARDLGTLYLTNTLAMIVSLGLLIPWTKIRMARYRAAHIECLARDMASIEAIERAQASAFGEELGDAFDLDLGI